MIRICAFLKRDETAAVTVDWIVLTAALAILGTFMVSLATGGMYSLSTKISDELSAMSS